MAGRHRYKMNNDGSEERLIQIFLNCLKDSGWGNYIVERERQILHNDSTYGHADVIIPKINSAIEFKGKGNDRYRKGVGQALSYSIAGYRPFLCMYNSEITQNCYDVCHEASVGLLGLTAQESVITVYHPNGVNFTDVEIKECGRQSLNPKQSRTYNKTEKIIPNGL